MMHYLGICMVVVVTGLVVSITANLVTEGIMSVLEKYRNRRAAYWAKLIKESTDTLVKEAKKVVEDYKKDKEFEKQLKDLL